MTSLEIPDSDGAIIRTCCKFNICRAKAVQKEREKIATNQDKVVKKDQEHSNSMLKEHGLVGKKYGKKTSLLFMRNF